MIQFLIISFLFVITASYENGAQILLDDNKLTGLNAAVFQPILDLFVNNGYPASSTFISLSNSKFLTFH